MRTAFIEALTGAAERDPRIWLLCGDLGYSVLEAFAARFPDRFLNCGVAEQNMTGMAAGLALAGRKVFVYSIANFPVMRCLEQIRNDVAYHGLDVKIVAVGGGLSYGALGYSHHGVEDLAVMRVLPNMTVVAPADPVETRLATEAVAALDGPCYLRLGKAGEPVLHERTPEFVLGRGILLRDGADLAVVATGAAVGIALDVASRLGAQGIEAAVASMPTIAPFDEEWIASLAARTRRVVTIEEHGAGGLASCVALALAVRGVRAELIPVTLGGEPSTVAGSQQHLRRLAGLDAAEIARSVAPA